MWDAGFLPLRCVPRARCGAKCRGADPGAMRAAWTPDQRRTVPLRFTLRRTRETLSLLRPRT
jgi:hypothetical protein